MLTKRENLLETIHGGHPDRFVNQFEFLSIIMNDPIRATYKAPKYGELNVTNQWGVTRSWPEGTPGPFPVHDDAHRLLKDITEWRDIVHAPSPVFPEAAWEPAIAAAEAVDRKDKFVSNFQAPGLFESLHYFMGMEDAMMNFYEEPDEMHDLIKYLTEWELDAARETCDHLHIDAVFHHDDWGSQRSTFFSPAMFEEFFVDAYKQIYGYYKERGVQLIVHHSDSYAATLIPDMIDMGIDIWQGVMTGNDVRKCIDTYGGKISFMGGIDSATVDHPGWTRQEVHDQVRRACAEYGKLYFIPCASQGGPMSTFDGVYQALTEEIDNASKDMF